VSDDEGLLIVDVSDPTNPYRFGHYNISRCTRGVYTLGNYAHVANYDNDFVIVDVSNPSSPTFVSIIFPSYPLMGVIGEPF
jgi:hypothetical protein